MRPYNITRGFEIENDGKRYLVSATSKYIAVFYLKTYLGVERLKTKKYLSERKTDKKEGHVELIN